jgi:hypothetical protein
LLLEELEEELLELELLLEELEEELLELELEDEDELLEELEELLELEDELLEELEELEEDPATWQAAAVTPASFTPILSMLGRPAAVVARRVMVWMPAGRVMSTNSSAQVFQLPVEAPRPVCAAVPSTNTSYPRPVEAALDRRTVVL